MEKFILKPENIMPGIILDPDSGKFKFYGKSCPVNAHEFYEPVLDWIENYTKKPNDTTILEFYLSYFNTVSAKNILKIMNKLENLSKIGKKVIIRWLYNKDDEILREAGRDFEQIVDVKFEFIAITSSEDDTEDMETYM